MGVNSTYGSHGHNHHRIATDHHFLKCHRSGMTCILCIASDKCGLQLTETEKTAYMRGELYCIAKTNVAYIMLQYIHMIEVSSVPKRDKI